MGISFLENVLVFIFVFFYFFIYLILCLVAEKLMKKKRNESLHHSETGEKGKKYFIRRNEIICIFGKANLM